MRYKPNVSVAVKAGTLITLAFFAGYAVFGKPKLFAGAAGHPGPSLSASDTIKNAANAIYARLSPQSRQFLSNLCDQVNRSGAMPQGCFLSEKLALEALAKWGVNFSENPGGVLAALEDMEKSARAMQHRSEADRIAYMNVLAQLQFFRELSRADQAQASRLLGNALKTYVVPEAP